MKIGFGAPVAGAWATPGYLAAFSEQAEEAGYASLWTFQRPAGARGLRHGAGVPQRARPDGGAGVRGRPDVADQARRGHPQPALRLPRLPGQAGDDRGRAVRRAARPRARHRLDAGGVRDDGRVHGPARGPGRGVPGRAADAMGRRGQLACTASSTRCPAGRQDPRPVQQPGPPVLLGGMSRPAMERAGRIAEGWITSSRADLTKISEAVSVIGEAAAAAGRDPAAVRIICRGVVLAGAEGRGQGSRRRPAPAVRQLRADPRGRRVARRAGRHRAVLRPELGPAGGQPRGRPAGRGGPGRRDPGRTRAALSEAAP